PRECLAGVDVGLHVGDGMARRARDLREVAEPDAPRERIGGVSAHGGSRDAEHGGVCWTDDLELEPLREPEADLLAVDRSERPDRARPRCVGSMAAGGSLEQGPEPLTLTHDPRRELF